MKRVFCLILFVFWLAAFASAQSYPLYRGARTTAQQPATCTPDTGQYYYNKTVDEFRYCSALNMWAAQGSSLTTLKLIDKSYIPLLSGSSYLTVGTATALPVSNHFWAVDVSLPISASGASKFFVGQRTNMAVSGNPSGAAIYGNFTTLTTSGLSGANNRLYGVSGSIDLAFPATQAIGGYFSVIHGGSGASGTVDLVGVRGVAGLSHNGALTNAYAGDFYLQVSSSSASVTDNAYILRGRLLNNTGVTVTNVRGLSLAGWTAGGGVVENSAAIYADTSIDVGTVTRYFINSSSTSPSKLAGDIAITDTTKGIVLKSPDGTCYRFTVANGGVLSAGAAITCP